MMHERPCDHDRKDRKDKKIASGGYELRLISFVSVKVVWRHGQHLGEIVQSVNVPRPRAGFLTLRAHAFLMHIVARDKNRRIASSDLIRQASWGG